MLKGKLLVSMIFCWVLSGNTVYATKAIANWDCVPYQVINGKFKLGVVAFHETGVGVEIFVNGTSLGKLTYPAYNDRTDVWEYWLEFDAANYADGEVKLTAIATPESSGHEARILDTLVLYANSGGSLTNSTVKWADCDNGNDNTGDGSEGNPYQTLEKAYVEVGSGGTVYLKTGINYNVGTSYPNQNYGYWTTISAAPGLAADDVKIVGYSEAGNSGRFGENHARWRNVSLYSDNASGYSTIFYFESTHSIWFAEGVVMYDARGMWNGSIPFNGNRGFRTYLTDCTIRNMSNAGGHFRRNVYIENICSDIYRGHDNLVGINVTVNTIDPGTTAAHPDFIQFYNPGDTVENIILYNNRAYNMHAQGLFGQNCRDVAFVNLLLEKDPPASYAISQWGQVWDHILLWHATTVDQGIICTDPHMDKTNLHVQNCNLTTFSAGPDTALPNAHFAYNHYKGKTWDQPKVFGTYATQGDQGFVDYDNDNYRVTDTSACYKSGHPLPGVPVDIDGVPYDPSTPNRGCFAAGNDAAIRFFKSNPVENIAVTVNPNPLDLKQGNRVLLGLELNRSQEIKLAIYTVKGICIDSQNMGGFAAGRQQIRWHPAGLRAGIYQVEIMVGSHPVLHRIVVLK